MSTPTILTCPRCQLNEHAATTCKQRSIEELLTQAEHENEELRKQLRETEKLLSIAALNQASMRLDAALKRIVELECQVARLTAQQTAWRGVNRYEAPIDREDV